MVTYRRPTDRIASWRSVSWICGDSPSRLTIALLSVALLLIALLAISLLSIALLSITLLAIALLSVGLLDDSRRSACRLYIGGWNDTVCSVPLTVATAIDSLTGGGIDSLSVWSATLASCGLAVCALTVCALTRGTRITRSDSYLGGRNDAASAVPLPITAAVNGLPGGTVCSFGVRCTASTLARIQWTSIN